MISLISCKNNQDSIEASTDFSGENIVNIMKKPTSVSKEKLAEIGGTSEDKIKIYNENFSPDVSKRMVLYSWPNGEIKHVKTKMGKELKIDAYNSLGIGLVKRISKVDFEKQFESPEFLQNEINRITKDETIDADIAIAEAKNLVANSKTQRFEKRVGIGELAYWETPVNALHIYTNGISFTVSTNLVNENQSKGKAEDFAKLIIENPIKN